MFLKIINFLNKRTGQLYSFFPKNMWTFYHLEVLTLTRQVSFWENKKKFNFSKQYWPYKLLAAE